MFTMISRVTLLFSLSATIVNSANEEECTPSPAFNLVNENGIIYDTRTGYCLKLTNYINDELYQGPKNVFSHLGVTRTLDDRNPTNGIGLSKTDKVKPMTGSVWSPGEEILEFDELDHELFEPVVSGNIYNDIDKEFLKSMLSYTEDEMENDRRDFMYDVSIGPMDVSLFKKNKEEKKKKKEEKKKKKKEKKNKETEKKMASGQSLTDPDLPGLGHLLKKGCTKKKIKKGLCDPNDPKWSEWPYAGEPSNKDFGVECAAAKLQFSFDCSIFKAHDISEEDYPSNYKWKIVDNGAANFTFNLASQEPLCPIDGSIGLDEKPSKYWLVGIHTTPGMTVNIGSQQQVMMLPNKLELRLLPYDNLSRGSSDADTGFKYCDDAKRLTVNDKLLGWSSWSDNQVKISDVERLTFNNNKSPADIIDCFSTCMVDHLP